MQLLDAALAVYLFYFTKPSFNKFTWFLFVCHCTLKSIFLVGLFYFKKIDLVWSKNLRLKIANTYSIITNAYTLLHIKTMSLNEAYFKYLVNENFTCLNIPLIIFLVCGNINNVYTALFISVALAINNYYVWQAVYQTSTLNSCRMLSIFCR